MAPSDRGWDIRRGRTEQANLPRWMIFPPDPGLHTRCLSKLQAVESRNLKTHDHIDCGSGMHWLHFCSPSITWLLLQKNVPFHPRSANCSNFLPNSANSLLEQYPRGAQLGTMMIAYVPDTHSCLSPLWGHFTRTCKWALERCKSCVMAASTFPGHAPQTFPCSVMPAKVAFEETPWLKSKRRRRIADLVMMLRR